MSTLLQPLRSPNARSKQGLVVETGVLRDLGDGDVVRAIEHLRDSVPQSPPPSATKRNTPGSGTTAVRSSAGSRRSA